MRRTTWFGVAIGLVLSAGVADAGLTCGRTVVLPGASKAEVIEKCGQPTRRQSADGSARSGRARGGGKGGGRETWIYDLGSRQLVRYLTFDRGRLRAIEFGGYGR